MTQPTNKHQETARQVAKDWDVAVINSRSIVIPTALMRNLIDRTAQALADAEAAAFTAGRADRQAEVEAVVTEKLHFAKDVLLHIETGYTIGDKNYFESKQIAFQEILDAILAPSSGPSFEQRIRAEIAESVKAVPVTTPYPDEMQLVELDGSRIERLKTVLEFQGDVIAVIERGGK